MTRTALIRTDRYTNGAIAFHWSIAALVIVNLALGVFHDSLLDGQRWVMPVHQAIGLTVLALTLGRIAWRVRHPAPPAPTDIPGWQRLVAIATHWGLYALMLILPVTGWVMVSAGTHPHPVSWFGLFAILELPVPAASGDPAHSAHVVLGWTMLGLVALHIAAALHHHLLLRDGVLARMVPAIARKG